MSQCSVALDKVVLEDWTAIHAWACLPEVCRYQSWGPNTEDQTRAFVGSAVQAWSDTPQCRFPHVARVDDASHVAVMQHSEYRANRSPASARTGTRSHRWADNPRRPHRSINPSSTFTSTPPGKTLPRPVRSLIRPLILGM